MAVMDRDREPTDGSTGMRFNGTLMSSILISALALGAAPALAADERADGSADVSAALERDLGLSPKQVKELGPAQDRAVKLDDELKRSLGDAFAGSQFDLKSGKLIVSLTDKGLLEKVEASGAGARLVSHSLRELEAIQANLDAAAGGPKDPGSREPTKPQSTPFTSWSIDPASNSVQVTVTKRQAGAAKEALAKYGDAVTLELSEALPEPAANWMDGGDAINSNSCSAGFNLRNPSTGQGYLLTAGHCVSSGSTLRGQGNVTFGTVLESWFPTFDDSLTRKTNAFWIQGPWVDTNPSNGGFVNSSGYTDLPFGFPICKSGITTKWTCGIITGKNQTVTYTGGSTVHGLTRHSACVEPGDSGGANVSVLGGYHAEGVTSGASMWTDFAGKKRCLSKLGLPNVSWYFPIADSLAYYGPKYGVTVW
jgi:streptogrisin C